MHLCRCVAVTLFEFVYVVWFRIKFPNRLLLEHSLCAAANAAARSEHQKQTERDHDQKALNKGRILNGNMDIAAPTASAMLLGP